MAKLTTAEFIEAIKKLSEYNFLGRCSHFMPYGTCCLRRSYFGMISWVRRDVKCFFEKQTKNFIQYYIKCFVSLHS